MGQTIQEVSEATPVAPGAEDPPPISAYLRRQRELRGIPIEELARITKIPQRSLERLEAGTWDQQPDGFVRGFVRTVALSLGLEPDETVARMLPEAYVRDEAVLARARRLRAAAAAVVLVLAGLGGVAWIATRPGGESTLTVEDLQIVHRRDAVRELARDAGLLAEGPPE